MVQHLPGNQRRSATNRIRRAGARGAAAEMLERRTLLSASFLAPVTTSIASTSLVVATATGDINGDGIPDLVAAHPDGTAQLFFGTATGALQPGQLFVTGGRVVALGDFTGDGNLDIATAAGVLPGNGNGTFGTAIAGFALPANTVALVAGDFNGDGKIDLAAATFTPTSAGNPQPVVGVSVLLGNGDGTFKAALAMQVGAAAGINSTYATFAVADFNGDGKTDLVTPFGVLLGNGDGTFKPAIALPLASSPSMPVFTAADFSGDGKIDLAVLPAASTTAGSAGAIEMLLGNGDGTFRDGGPVSLGSAAAVTVTALASADLNNDGLPDLIAGISPTSGNSSVAALLNSGGAVFAAPAFFAVSGVPVALSTANFNADAEVDVLALTAPSGTATGTRVIGSAVVLLNTTPVPQPPTVSLKVSANPTVASVPVQLTATVTGPSGAATPTGMVTFLDGTTPLGTATLKSGVAVLATSALPAGTQSITAFYSGDANYTTSSSGAVIEKVLLTGAHTPLLVGSIAQVTLPSVFLAGDKGTASVTIANEGGATASGRVAVNLFATTDGQIDASAIPLNVPSLRSVGVHVASGGSTTITGRFVAGQLPPGRYAIVGEIAPVSGLTAAQVSAASFAGTAAFQAAGNVFGTVGTHHNLVLTVTNAAGARAMLTITGAGMGTVTQAAGQTNVTVTGTGPSSVLHLKGQGGTFAFGTITVTGPLATLDGARAAVTGGLTITGSAKRVTLASAGLVGISGASIALGGGVPVTLAVGDAEGVTLNSAAALRTLTASTWQGGAIIAPSISTLAVGGTLSANVFVHAGGKVQSAKLGSITGGTWAVPGGIGSLRIGGNLSSARIFAGADAGPDNVLGTADDLYVAATISSVAMNGSDTASLVAAGVAPAAGGTIDTGLLILPRGAIRSIAVGGAVSADSRFLAASLPATATLAGVKVKTATDPHFHV